MRHDCDLSMTDDAFKFYTALFEKKKCEAPKKIPCTF